METKQLTKLRSSPVTELVDDETGVTFVNTKTFQGFALKWLVNGRPCYQHLLLGIRGGDKEYITSLYMAARKLYARLRKKGVITRACFNQYAYGKAGTYYRVQELKTMGFSARTN